MASSININQNNNDVTLQDNNGGLSITNNNTGTTINVTQPVTNVVTVATPGPQGQQGPIGPIPSSGSFTGAFTGSFSGSFTGSLQGTASYALTASYLEGYISPFPFTGSAIISGSLGVTGSVSATAGFSGSFSGSFQGNGSGLTNIPASGITGLNLSQIATGSVSASVSLGTGSFTVTSGSSTFMFVSSSGNVGFGTTTPASKLDVNQSTIGITQIAKFGSSYQGNYAVVSVGDSYAASIAGYQNASTKRWEITNAGDIILNHPSSVPTISTAGQLRLSGGTTVAVTSGNFLIGTSIDAGYKLDVNGTARVKGTGTTSATTAFTVQNSAGSTNLQCLDNGAVQVINEGNFSVARFGNNLLSTGQSVSRIATYNNYIQLENTYTQIVNGTNIWSFRQNSYTETYAPFITFSSYKAIDASAQMEVSSTTKGFLPPRMTLAQRVAISSPASGLIVYETGSAATEGLWLNETTGWQQLLTNSGSQSISGSLNVTSFTASDAVISGNVTVLGTASINTLIVNQTQLSTGSNQLGDAANDTQTLWGTVDVKTGPTLVTGSLNLNGFATGSVLFTSGSAGVVTGSANLFWDNTTSGLRLQTENISSTQRGLSIAQFNNGQQAPLISFQKARGTIASPTDVTTGDLIGFFQFSARMGGAYTVDRASFGANAASTSGIGVFIIGGSSNSTYTPGLYVHPSNNVTIGSGQSVLSGITDAGFKLDVNGTFISRGNAVLLNGLTSNASFSTAGISSDGRMALYGTDSNGTIQLLAHRGAFAGGAATLFPGSVSVGGLTGAIGIQGSTLAIQSYVVGTAIINSGTHKSLIIGTPNTAASNGFGGNADTIDIGTFSSVSNTWGGIRPSITYTALNHIFRVNNGTGQNNPGTNALYISSSGNVGIGISTPNYTLDVSGSSEFIGNVLLTGSLSITGSAGTGSALYAYKSGSTVVDIQGSQGQLFSVTDDLSNSLFSVNTIAGLPVIEAFATNDVYLGKYNTYPIKTTASGTLAVITGSISGSVVGTLTGTSSFALTASYVNPLIQTVQITGSASVTGSVSINGGLTFTGGANTATIDTNAANYQSSRIGLIGGYDFRYGAFNSGGVVIGYNPNTGVNGVTTQGGQPFYLGQFWSGANAFLSIYSGNAQTMYLSNSQLVGIGTSSPNARLQVRGTGATSSTTALLVQNANASASLAVLDNGYVGIGNPSPSSSLQVGDGITSTNSLYVGGNALATQTIGFAVNGSTVYHGLTSNANSGEFRIGAGFNGGGHYIVFSSGNNTERMRITSGGNILIGTTTNAGFKLDVSGSSRFTDNVGIGRTPTSSLDVAGTTRISGSFNTATSGSILTVQGSGSAQPIFTVQGSQGELFSITDSLSGSLFSVNDISGLPILEVFSDSSTLIGNYQDPMLITTAKVVQTNSGSFTMYSLPTASYDTAFFEYSVRSGSNARAGTIMAIQLGSTVNFTETTTTDFGSTSAVSFTVIVTGSNMALTGSSTSGAWTIKTIVRGL